MRIKLSFETIEKESIPINYNHLIQGWIYNHLEGKFGKRLHTLKGPKFFTFSQLFFSDYKVKKDRLILEEGSVGKLYIASVNEELLGHLGKAKTLNIGPTSFLIKNVELITPRIGYKFDTLSPINITYTDNNQRIDIPADHPLFFERIKKNLLKKYQILYSIPYDNNLIIDISSITHIKEKRILIKNTFHRAYHIKNLKIWANEKMLKLALDAGLGERNSMGFGMVMSKEAQNKHKE